MRYVHASDLHLDHLNDEERAAFLASLAGMRDADTVTLVTGDTTVFRRLWEDLDAVAQAGAGPTLYVLGNHDLWGGSFALAPKALRNHSAPDGKGVFMDLVGSVTLPDGAYVVGDSGWYDGRNGEQGNPRFIMNDWFYIEEYRGKNPRSFSAVLADARASAMEAKLRAAIASGAERLIALTHVPPWVESCRHQGRVSDDYALPWFSSRAMADAIDQVSSEHPNVMIEVLAGHTHDRCSWRRSGNVNVTVAAADYGRPVARAWEPTLWRGA